MTILKKCPDKKPQWLQTLLRLIAEQNMNPRQISLLAGLNPTAVRDMLAGRARYPRYDTLQALAKVLNTTPAYLMGDDDAKRSLQAGQEPHPAQLNLLTEIIARVHEVADDMKRELSPRELAIMSTTIYQQMRDTPPGRDAAAQLTAQAQTLVAYAHTSGRVMVKRR